MNGTKISLQSIVNGGNMKDITKVKLAYVLLSFIRTCNGNFAHSNFEGEWEY